MIEIHNFGDFKMIEIFNIEYFMLLIDIIHFCIPFPPFNDTHCPICMFATF